MNRVLASVCLIVLNACAPGAAPVPVATSPAAAAPDADLSHVFQGFVFAQLADRISRAASDTVHRPWQFDVAPQGPSWAEFTARLQQALRARAVTPADTLFSVASVGPIVVAGDTAMAEVSVRDVWRCPPDRQERARGGTAWAQSVRQPDGTWGRAVALRGTAGNSAPCLTRGP